MRDRYSISGITVNKNLIPFDKESPFKASGIRIGTPAITTRGMGLREMEEIAELIVHALRNMDNPSLLKEIRLKVLKLCSNFPLYQERISAYGL